MSMKKKFLALALASMVAMPVVANATQAPVVDNTVGGLNTDTLGADLAVNGSVTKADGSAAAGRIEVQLPTTMSFTVNKDGVFSGPTNFEIRNTGSEPVKVDVIDFLEGNESAGIAILEKSQLVDRSQKNRTDVSLVLQGEQEVDLAAAKNTPKTLFGNIQGTKTGVVQVNGVAGTKKDNNEAESNGANETFTIKFQITHV